MLDESRRLNIGTFECWKCKKPMKVCWITDKTFYGPEDFLDAEIRIAKENGVIIDKVNSKTANEQYNANICPHCKAFVGKFFIHDYLYSEEKSIDL